MYKEDIIIERMREERSGEGKLKQMLGGLWIPDTDFSCVTLERPYIKKLPSVSCLKEGVYKYRVINKTPTCSLSHILILGTPYTIKTIPNYEVANKPIIVGKEFVDSDICYNLNYQRETLSYICKMIPETGTIRFVDAVK